MSSKSKKFSQLIIYLLLSVMSLGTASCHSSKKTVKGSSGVPVRKIDYGEMRNELKARHYDIPMIGALVAEAAKWVGVPYKYAGNDRRGVDCSGLTSQVFLNTLNVKLPRSSREQQQWCANVKRENLQPGDLVFFATGSNRSRVSHVGIYVGDGEMIHASSSRGVIISNLDEKYYSSRYHSSGRPEIIGRIYADAGRKAKKDNGKSKNSSRQVHAPAESDLSPSISGALTISGDELIEIQADSIADAIRNRFVHEHQVPVSKPAAAPLPPTVTVEETTDSVFGQFFD